MNRAQDPTEELLGGVLRRIRDHATSRNYYLNFRNLEVIDNGVIGYIIRVAFEHEEIRYAQQFSISPIPIIDPQQYSINVAISSYEAQIRADTDRLIVNRLIQQLDEHMRDWNTGNTAQQAQQRQEQRDEARRANLGLPTNREEVGRPYQVVNTMPMDTRYTTASTNFVRDNSNPWSTYNAPGLDMSWESKAVVTKELLAQLLEEGLEISISMDESDGEVTAEVEVKFNGKTIASDSDSIQL